MQELKDKEREKATQRENKMTNDRKAGGNRPNQGMKQKSRLPKALQKPVHPQPKKEEPKEEIKEIKLPEKLTIRELADAMKVQPSAIVKKLFMKEPAFISRMKIRLMPSRKILGRMGC